MATNFIFKMNVALISSIKYCQKKKIINKNEITDVWIGTDDFKGLNHSNIYSNIGNRATKHQAQGIK